MNHIHLQNSIPSFSSQAAPSTMMGLYPSAASSAATSVSLPQGNYFHHHQQQQQQQQQPFNTTSPNILNFPFLSCKSFLNFPMNGSPAAVTTSSNNNNTNNNNNNNNNGNPLIMSTQNDQDNWNRAISATSTAANVSSAALAMIMMQQSSNMQQQQQQQQQQYLSQYQSMYPHGMDASKLSLFQNLMQSNKSNVVTSSSTTSGASSTNPKIMYPSYLTQPQLATPPLGVSIPESLSTAASTMDEKKKKRYRLNSDELNGNQQQQQYGDEQSKRAKTTAKVVKNTEVLDRLKTVCERCTSLKAKCIKNEETGICQRCAKWGHPCVFLHQRKRGPMSSSSKKEQLKNKQQSNGTTSATSPRSPSLSSVSASPNPEFSQCNAKSESPAPDAEKISNVVN